MKKYQTKNITNKRRIRAHSVGFCSLDRFHIETKFLMKFYIQAMGYVWAVEYPESNIFVVEKLTLRRIFS